ncbi:MAG: ROK family transcriptional regulator [Clostridia bacterium]|nr:ROK family transcriptional regulator [Clostridia bacterium]
MGADSWNILRSQGRIRIRKQLWYNGPLYRTDIAEALSLSLPAVTTVVNELIENGTAQETKDESAGKRLGRKAALVDIRPDARYFIGVEMRKDSRQACLTDYRGNILISRQESVSLPDYRDNIRAAALLTKEILNASPVPSERIDSIGIAVPGVTDRENGVLSAHRMYRWFDCPVASDLATLTGWNKPVVVENDACARAFGIRMLRREEMRRTGRFAYLFIARGLSCPLLPFSPADVGDPLGIGEIGYMIVQADAALSSDAISGHISDLAGERAIMDACHAAMRKGEAPKLSALCGGDIRPTIPQVLAAEQAGDAAVTAILERAVRYLAITLANVINFVQPDMIFVDSRLFSAGQNRALLTDTVNRYLVAPHRSLPAFSFVEADRWNGSRCAALCAIRRELNQYGEE